MWERIAIKFYFLYSNYCCRVKVKLLSIQVKILFAIEKFLVGCRLEYLILLKQNVLFFCKKNSSYIHQFFPDLKIMLLLQMNFVAFAVILTNANAAVAGLGDLAEHHVEIVSATDDGGTLSVRTRRAAGGDVCKYRKGAWSDCDPLVLVC